MAYWLIILIIRHFAAKWWTALFSHKVSNLQFNEFFSGDRSKKTEIFKFEKKNRKCEIVSTKRSPFSASSCAYSNPLAFPNILYAFCPITLAYLVMIISYLLTGRPIYKMPTLRLVGKSRGPLRSFVGLFLTQSSCASGKNVMFGSWLLKNLARCARFF